MNWRKIWNDPVWSKVIAGLILAAPAVAWNATPRTFLAHSFLVLVGGSGAGLLIWVSRRPMVAWDFDNCLGMVGGGGIIFFNGFQASGVNRSRDGIHSVTGHLVSSIDNTRSPDLRFVIGGQPVPPEETTGIPPGASFQVMIPFTKRSSSDEARLSEPEFLRRWSTFRFIAKLDDYKYERVFSPKRVIRVVEDFKRIANPLPKPEVRRKV